MFAVLAINLAVNQVVAGTALDIFALGVTGVFYRRMFGITGQALIVQHAARSGSDRLARTPLTRPGAIRSELLVYLALLLVPVVWCMLYRTRYGLGLRAAGERPEAADALGLGVYRLRWQAMLISGVLTGLSRRVSDARVYQHVRGGDDGGTRLYRAGDRDPRAQWRPLGVAAAAVLFGAAIALQFTLQAVGTGFPYQLFLALPYVLTLVVLTLFGGQGRAPSALGEPYLRP